MAGTKGRDPAPGELTPKTCPDQLGSQPGHGTAASCLADFPSINPEIDMATKGTY